MSTKTYIPINEVPQRIIDGCKDEFGMEIVNVSKRDALVIAGSSERYCGDCDDYVDAVQEIGMTWITDDENEDECVWDEIGDEFCPECGNEALADDEDSYWEAEREEYEIERGLDRWRGID